MAGAGTTVSVGMTRSVAPNARNSQDALTGSTAIEDTSPESHTSETKRFHRSGIGTPPSFSSDEDKSLLLLVVCFASGGKIQWDRVLHEMSPTSKNVQDLQERLEYLTNVDTTLLYTIPQSYTAGIRALMDNDTYMAIEEIFDHITRSDVHQPRGKRNLNVGEMAPLGVTTMLKELKLTSEDVFLDIGSGTGSLLAQVMLQFPVNKAYGVEIRQSLAEKSREAIQAASYKYPRLEKVQVIAGDIKSLPIRTTVRFLEATIIFCNNMLFLPEDNVGLHGFICSFDGLGDLRAVLLTQPFCTRCTPGCEDRFCKDWKLKTVMKLETCWSQEPQKVYMYTRITLINETLMNLINIL